jgi:predicted nucleotidyltransferase
MKTTRAKRTPSRRGTQLRNITPSGTSLADALFTATQQRVLALLFGQPDRSFFATELISLARAGSGGVQRELKRLADSGLLVVSRVGNQKHYQANRASPVFDEVCNLVRKTVGLCDPLRNALMSIADRITHAVVYGSVAKRTDTAASDIDLLVVSDELSLEDLYALLAPVEESLARKVNPTLYTSRELERRRSSGNAFLKRVLTGDHIVLIGDDLAA